MSSEPTDVPRGRSDLPACESRDRRVETGESQSLKEQAGETNEDPDVILSAPTGTGIHMHGYPPTCGPPLM